MSAFSDALQQGHDLRNRWRCRPAAAQYRRALTIATTAEEQCTALHMLGVTCKMWGRLEMADEALTLARRLSPNKTAIGNINRDLADTASLMGDHAHAKELISLSLEQLHGTGVPYYSSKGFEGRILQRAGDLPEALESFESAHQGLQSSQSGSPELFNLIPYINALYEAGDDDTARSWIYPAMELADQYGAWIHRLRLRALYRFGYRADNLIQRCLPLQRFIPFL